MSDSIRQRFCSTPLNRTESISGTELSSVEISMPFPDVSLIEPSQVLCHLCMATWRLLAPSPTATPLLAQPLSTAEALRRFQLRQQRLRWELRLGSQVCWTTYAWANPLRASPGCGYRPLLIYDRGCKAALMD